MPTDDVVVQLKRQYGQVCSVKLKNVDYVFRPMTGNEHKEFFLHEEWSSADIEDQIVVRTLVWPESDRINLDRLPAGVVSTIAEKILSISGFGDPKPLIEMIDNERRTMGNEPRTLMKAFVLATMPAYSEEDLDALTYPLLVKKVVLAEKIIEVHQAIMGGSSVTLDLVDPEQEAELHSRVKQKHAASKSPGEAGLDDPIARRLRGLV